LQQAISSTEIRWVVAGVVGMSSDFGGGPISLGARRGLILHSLKSIFCPPQSFLHVLANVFASNYVFKFGLPNELSGLFAGATENQRAIGRMKFSRHFFQRV
jgi:hypothetical protein